jgi:putative transposase
LADGHRESIESWADLLRDCKRREMRAPVVAVGDGALGFWPGSATSSPRPASSGADSTRSPTCSTACPSRPSRARRPVLAEIWNAEDREHAEAAVRAFDAAYGAKWPKATAKVTEDLDVLLAFYDYPAEHWVHLRTTNPIESTFATVRLRQRVTKGPGSHAAGVEMAFKLIESAQQRWRAVNAPHLVALVRGGARF